MFLVKVVCFQNVNVFTYAFKTVLLKEDVDFFQKELRIKYCEQNIKQFKKIFYFIKYINKNKSMGPSLQILKSIFKKVLPVVLVLSGPFSYHKNSYKVHKLSQSSLNYTNGLFYNVNWFSLFCGGYCIVYCD